MAEMIPQEREEYERLLDLEVAVRAEGEPRSALTARALKRLIDLRMRPPPGFLDENPDGDVDSQHTS